MKILQVVDIFDWAIGGLAKTIKDQNQHLDIKIIAVHPKDLRKNKDVYVEIFKNELKSFNPDIVHFHYWDTANNLAEYCEGAKIILTHHNQKNLLSHKWEKIDTLVVHTQKAKKILEDNGHWNVEIIQHGIDIEKFRFNTNYKEDAPLGYVGRVCGWKGLKEIAKYAGETGKKVICMGRIDKADYWQECQKYKDSLDLRFGTPADDQVKVYHEMGVYVGNSCDGIEEGTLGLLEAMACGVPVVTTPSGEAKDIIDEKNGILIDFENYESLKEGLSRFFRMTKKEKEDMRQKAWHTVRKMSREVMARNYEKLYYKTNYYCDLVSVIIPTYNRKENLIKILDAYDRQSYKPLEIIVIDDNSTDGTKEAVFKWKGNTPLKYLNTENEGYGLAMARNMGIFEATGHYIVFNDDRLLPDMFAVEMFVNNIKKIKGRSAVWGDKGAGKRDFIENFFIIRKKDIATAGMFNERINEYGGQSQEIRERLRNLGYDLQFEAGAVATQLNRSRKEPRRYETFRSKTKLWKLSN